MKIPRSSYYYKPVHADTELQRRLLSGIEKIALEFPRYGYRRITRQLKREGLKVNHKVVLKLMKEKGLLCKRKRSFVVHTTNSNHPYPVYPNLTRGLIPIRLNELWVADITYIRIQFGFVYLAVIMDALSRKAIGWAISRSMDRTLTISALKMAIEQRKPEVGCIHHSDRGVQYAAEEYVDLLKAHKFLISMSGKGNPYDNALAESFMKTLKYDEVYLSEYRTFEDVLENVPAFIENVYNTKRLDSSIGYLPPSEFESQWLRNNSPVKEQAA